MTAKVKQIVIGDFYDHIVVDIDSKETQIVFDKIVNVTKFIDKEINLVVIDGVYTIEEIKEVKKDKTK